MKVYYVKFKWTDLVLWALIIILTVVLLFMLISHRTVNTFNQDPIYKGNTNEKVVAFACNVAWGDDYLKQMIDYFDTKSIKITFFFEGNWAEKNKDMIKEIYAKGHEIASHGYTHTQYTRLSDEQIKQDIQKNDDLLKSVTGKVPLLFAPPYGDVDDRVDKIAEGMGHKVIMWTVDTIDWRNDGTPQVVDRVLKKYTSGSIILMHPTKDTIGALPTIVNELTRAGYKIEKVSDII